MLGNRYLGSLLFFSSTGEMSCQHYRSGFTLLRAATLSLVLAVTRWHNTCFRCFASPLARFTSLARNLAVRFPFNQSPPAVRLLAPETKDTVYLDNSRSSGTGVMPVSPQASPNKCFTGRTIAQDSFLKFLSLAWNIHTRLRETD